MKIKRPNVVLIMADDLGYGDLGCYGNTYIKTPNIDFLASQGVKFIDFHSNGSVCSPTRAALMTGQYQQRTGVEGVVTAKSHREVGLSLDQTTLAEEFKKHGYNTAMFGKWHLGYANTFNPSHQGFDSFEGFVSGNVDYHAHIDQEGYLDWWKDDEIKNVEGYSTDLITDNGVGYIQANNPEKTGQPFFLYLAHESPHYPYQRRIDRVHREVGVAKSLKVAADSIASIYKEMVEVMDEGVGKVVEALKETGAYENTILIFISDNGASGNGSNGVLRGHKSQVYEGGSRVPAIFCYPGVISKAVISSETVLCMDIYPTVLDFIGEKPSSDRKDGISFKKTLIDSSTVPKRDVFYSFKKHSFIRHGDWKLVRKELSDGETLELYNLDSDLGESNDVASSNPQLVFEMAGRLAQWSAEVHEGVEQVSH